MLKGTVFGPLSDFAILLPASAYLPMNDLIYRVVKCDDNSIVLQHDLLSQWSTVWHMKFILMYLSVCANLMLLITYSMHFSMIIN